MESDRPALAYLLQWQVRRTRFVAWDMNYPAHNHHPRLLEQRRDDDEPAPPWPWQPPASGQAARADRQQLAHLGEVNDGWD